jgi:hypothetical protein
MLDATDVGAGTVEVILHELGTAADLVRLAVHRLELDEGLGKGVDLL